MEKTYVVYLVDGDMVQVVARSYKITRRRHLNLYGKTGVVGTFSSYAWTHILERDTHEA